MWGLVGRTDVRFSHDAAYNHAKHFGYILFQCERNIISLEQKKKKSKSQLKLDIIPKVKSANNDFSFFD